MEIYIEIMNMQKLSIIVALLCVLISPLGALAQNKPQPVTVGKTGLEDTAGEAGIRTDDLSSLAGSVVGYGLGILGTVFLILMIVGGIIWMTAAGNDQRITRAKGLLVAAFIGIAIVFFSYAITALVGGVIAQFEKP